MAFPHRLTNRLRQFGQLVEISENSSKISKVAEMHSLRMPNLLGVLAILGLLSPLSPLSLPGLLNQNLGLVAEAQTSAPTDSTEAQVLEALEMLKQGKLDEAIQRLEVVRSSGRALPQQLALLGTLYLQAGSPDKADKILRPMAEKQDADPAVLFNAGRAAMGLAEVDRAADFFQRSIALAGPTSPGTRDLGLLEAVRGNAVEAYKLLRPWALANPEDEQARASAALLAIQLNRLTEAEVLLSDLPQQDARVRLLWGRLLLQRGEPIAAISTLQPLLENPPPEMERDLRKSLADAHLISGDAKAAVELLDGKSEGDPVLSLTLAEAAYQTGDVEKSLATLEPLAKSLLANEEVKDPLGASIAQEYGRALISLGRSAEAIGALRRAVAILPDGKQSWQLLGQALAANGDREEAQQALARFQELSESEVPESLRDLRLSSEVEDPAAAALRKAMEAAQREDYTEAIATLRKEQELSPDDPRPRLLEARILIIAGRTDEALVVAQSLVDSDPASADALYQRGSVRMAQKENDLARRDYEAAIRLAPAHTAAMSDLAVLAITEGKKDEARALLTKVLEIRPGDRVAEANLERLNAGSS